MPNWFKIALVFVGTVIGAGFASGQEILQFFVSYGFISIWGIGISGVLFGVVTTVILIKISKTKSCSLEEYFINFKNKYIVKFFNIIITLFMITSYCVMVSASGAVFEEQLNMPMWSGILVMCAICMWAFWNGVDGIVVVNAVLTPIMIIGIIFIGSYMYISNIALQVFADYNYINNWLMSSIIYVSYNTLTLVAVMTSMQKLVENKKQAIYAGVCGGFILCLISAVLWCILYNVDISNAEIPMVEAAATISNFSKNSYLIILYMAIITTAVANGFAGIKNIVSTFKCNEKACIMYVCGISFIVAFVRFSSLVTYVYPFFGVLGLATILVTLIDGVKYLKN